MMNMRHNGYSADGRRVYCIPGDTPDNSGMNAAAVSQAALSKEQLAWAKQIYEETAPDRAKAAERAGAVSDAQLAGMNAQTAIAKDYADYNKSTYRPLEQSVIAGAQNYDTQDRREAEAGKAIADVTQAASSARAQSARAMSRMGVNPNSGRALAANNGLDMAQAAAQAGAAAKARTQVETQGYARKMDAANLGRNLASNQATSAAMASQMGSSAVNSSGAGLNALNSGNQVMQTGFSGASQSMASAGNIYGNIASTQNQANANENQLLMAGMRMIPTSDVNAKEDINPVADDEALAQVAGTPVATWKYKPGQGEGEPGAQHTGPMAQDVEQTMGAKAAPGGKAIDLITLNGKNMAAIGALKRKFDGMEAKVDSIAAMLGANVNQQPGMAVAA